MAKPVWNVFEKIPQVTVGELLDLKSATRDAGTPVSGRALNEFRTKWNLTVSEVLALHNFLHWEDD